MIELTPLYPILDSRLLQSDIFGSALLLCVTVNIRGSIDFKMSNFDFIGTVSRELRLVLLYINQKLFSRAIVAHHKSFNFIKRTLHNQQKKIQHMNGPTILDGSAQF